VETFSQVRGTIEEAEELQDKEERDQMEENGERIKPASRDRQKEILGRMPPSDRPGRGRSTDHSPYEAKHHHQGYDTYDDY